MDTWLFLGALLLATVGVLTFYGLAIRGWHPPAPRADIVSPEHFVRMRGDLGEVDLGRGWRATDDAHAAWHVWWVPRTGELIGLRMSEFPPPPGPGSTYTTPYRGSALLDPYGLYKYTGMRVLGHLEHRPSRELCEQLRSLPDGLGVLCGGTHGDDADDSGADDLTS